MQSDAWTSNGHQWRSIVRSCSVDWMALIGRLRSAFQTAEFRSSAVHCQTATLENRVCLLRTVRAHSVYAALWRSLPFLWNPMNSDLRCHRLCLDSVPALNLASPRHFQNASLAFDFLEIESYRNCTKSSNLARLVSFFRWNSLASFGVPESGEHFDKLESTVDTLAPPSSLGLRHRDPATITRESVTSITISMVRRSQQFGIFNLPVVA